MKIVKIFDEYINLEEVSSIYIEESDRESCEQLYDVYLNLREEEIFSHRWMGAFESRKDAEDAIEELFSCFGIKAVEFVPDFN